MLSRNAEFFDSLRGWLVGNLKADFANEWRAVRLILAGVAVALMWSASIAIHEIGHLLAGQAMGFRFRYVQIGRFRLDRAFRVSRKPRSSHGQLGAVCFFPQGMEDRPWRYAFMVLTGPLTNLLVGTFILLLPFQKSFVLESLMLFSMFQGFFNITPVAGDGNRLLTIMLNRRDHEASVALQQLAAEHTDGVDFENLSPALIAKAARLREKSTRTSLAHYFAVGFWVAHRDYDAAAASLEKCFEWSPWAVEGVRQGMIYTAAVVQGKRRRVSSAEQWLSQLPAKLGSRNRLQIEGAILEAREDFVGALGKIAECEELLSKEPEGASKTLARKQLEKWKIELDQRSSQVSS
jgi:hypothetical protein